MTVPVLIWLAAIVAANLTVAAFGPGWSIVNAFLLIGLDLSLRDRLHDAWRDDRIALRMGALIGAGGLISWALNADAGRIALASVVAFTAAMAVDAATYHAMRRRRFVVRANVSNVPAAIVDSLIFPAVAFGAFLPTIVAGQAAAKIAGGALWAAVIVEIRNLRGAPAGARP